MKYLFLVSIFLLVIGHQIQCQIVQPGNLELNIYPGSEIDLEGYSKSSKNETITTLSLFDDFQKGLICFNERLCYNDLTFNIDLLNNVLEIKKDDGVFFINLSLIHSIIDSTNHKTFAYISNLDNTANFLARIIYDSDSIKLYKRFLVKKLQADYRPEFDTGSKIPTYEISEDFIFVDETNKVSSFNKVRRGLLIRNLPENQLKLNLSKNKFKLKTIEDLRELIVLVYSK